jgi:DNA polymerase-3 subunit epsilon
MREIVLDTETTGLDPAQGHRIVEVGCVELVNHIASGREFQRYVNPERDMPTDAFAVHGLSEDFLRRQPTFADVAAELLEFIGDAPLVIHNAGFDLAFLNAEFARLGLAPLPAGRAIDTVRLARSRFPGAQASLDALCRRFGIDASARTRHGALLDAGLLADVYLELIGGRQPDLSLAVESGPDHAVVERKARPPRPHAPNEAELAAHAAFVGRLKQPIWGS